MMYKEYTIGGELYHSSAGIKNKVYKYIDKIRTKSGKWRYIYENAKTGVKNTAKKAAEGAYGAYRSARDELGHQTKYAAEQKSRANTAKREIDWTKKHYDGSDSDRKYLAEQRANLRKANSNYRETLVGKTESGLKNLGMRANTAYKNEVKPAAEKAYSEAKDRAHKYIDKVRTKSGNWRYIYDTKVTGKAYTQEAAHKRRMAKDFGESVNRDQWRTARAKSFADAREATANYNKSLAGQVEGIIRKLKKKKKKK